MGQRIDRLLAATYHIIMMGHECCGTRTYKKNQYRFVTVSRDWQSIKLHNNTYKRSSLDGVVVLKVPSYNLHSSYLGGKGEDKTLIGAKWAFLVIFFLCTIGMETKRVATAGQQQL